MSKCGMCGHPMPPGEEMFNYHGYSGPCPEPPLTDRSLPSVPEQPPATTCSACGRSVAVGHHDPVFGSCETPDPPELVVPREGQEQEEQVTRGDERS